MQTRTAFTHFPELRTYYKMYTFLSTAFIDIALFNVVQFCPWFILVFSFILYSLLYMIYYNQNKGKYQIVQGKLNQSIDQSVSHFFVFD